MEIFAILFKKDNKKVYGGYNKLMLGKIVKNEKGENKIGIYSLDVNSNVNIKYYYTLLKEGDFSNSNFKVIELEELKKNIENKKDMILKAMFSKKDNEIKDFVKNLLT